MKSNIYVPYYDATSIHPVASPSRLTSVLIIHEHQLKHLPLMA